VESGPNWRRRRARDGWGRPKNSSNFRAPRFCSARLARLDWTRLDWTELDSTRLESSQVELSSEARRFGRSQLGSIYFCHWPATEIANQLCARPARTSPGHLLSCVALAGQLVWGGGKPRMINVVMLLVCVGAKSRNKLLGVWFSSEEARNKRLALSCPGRAEQRAKLGQPPPASRSPGEAPAKP